MLARKPDEVVETKTVPDQPESPGQREYVPTLAAYPTPQVVANAWAAVATGMLVGMVAGIVMMLVMMVLFAATGRDFWEPLKLFAVPAYGPYALITGANAVAVGLMFHLMIASLIGIIYAALVALTLGRPAAGASAALGVLYGAIVWLLAQFVFLPMTYPLIAAAFPTWLFAFGHLAYGLTLGLWPSSYRAS